MQKDLTAWRSGLALIAIAGASALSGCSRTPPVDAAPAAAAPNTTLALPDGFVNRVWRVQASSSLEPGMLYVFLSDGTLLITANSSTPTLGKWRYENNALTMIEEGQAYPTDIVKLSREQFTIRSHNPGTPVEITLEPAAR